jgi:histidine ammonia-lyase
MIALDGESLSLPDLQAIADDAAPVSLSPRAVRAIAAAREVVDRYAGGDTPAYGINTGFGSLAEVKIAKDALGALQRNLLRSHAAGVDAPLAPRAVRAMMALRANVLAKGYSGIRVATVERLIAALNARLHPIVPSRGSVGASGDLAPLAHLALVLIGEGAATVGDDPTVLDGATALARAGLAPLELGAKEGLALINGTQASAAVGALAVLGAERLARAADITAALAIDGLRGSYHPFEARLHQPRPHPGQLASAANLLALLQDSTINRSHENCGRVQDAYSMRCAPQVHGAARDAFAHARTTLEIEANAATDNPMVFADRGDIVSGGNFHGAPIAVAADLLVLGLVQLATISERRADRLVNPALSGLAPFLTRDSGLHSGYMMAQVTAAALTSELKTLAHPSSADTIPTSANREDHVSMSMAATLKAQRALELATQVVAIEMLLACQAIDLLAPLSTSPALAAVHARVRVAVATLGDDRPPSPDIRTISELITSGAIERACPRDVK